MDTKHLVISVMLAVADAPAAAEWYKKALGAVELWNLGSVIGLEIAGSPFFLGQPQNNGWEDPEKLGTTTTRIEVFCDDPNTFIERAINAGANGSIDHIQNHEMPWGIHRQGSFFDPFGHKWLVGDHSPLHYHQKMENDIKERRLITTGVDGNGKSVVISDSLIEPRTAEAVPGYGWHRLWSMDEIPCAPNDGTEPGGPAHFPVPGGLRFIAFTIPPSSNKGPIDLDMNTAMLELEEKFPGRAAHMESHQAGLHTTATIDFIYVADGEIWLELDDQKEVHLNTGDSLIQNGTRHAWRNHSDKPCTLVVTIVGAKKAL